MMIEKPLDYWLAGYQCTAEGNDRVYREFTALTDSVPFLKAHRDYVEANSLGMGFRAFHYMWLLVLDDLRRRFGAVSALEIGVFKGQVVSLWGMIGHEMGIPIRITALSPFAGNQPRLRIVRSLMRRFSRRYRERRQTGSLYYDDDYLDATRSIFERFAGPFDRVRIVKGLSTDPAIHRTVASETFQLVYIDGDHSYEAVASDIAGYAPLVAPGGYLVMDDASFYLPTVDNAATPFFKGYESVARACEAIPDLGFVNVLNVGHNRVYRRNG